MSTRRASGLVFVVLCCLYALTAGGQGYSVDGTFSYRVSESLASDPSLTFVRQNADTLRRWGPVMPALGVPFTWAGVQLARLAPPRDTVSVGGERLALHDWPAIGQGTDGELRIAAPRLTGAVQAIRVVSFLSLSTGLADGETVAEALLLDASGSTLGSAPLRAGRETAEWAYGVSGAERPRHALASVAGYWPGNAEGRLYWSDLPLSLGAGQSPAAIVFRYRAMQGRLHVRAVRLRGSSGAAEVAGPAGWTEADQQGLLGRFAFSCLNVPVVSLLCALLVPVGRVLGYRLPAAVSVALGAGTATLLWPYAKHDFAEPLAGLFIVSAVLALFAGFQANGRRQLALFALVGIAGAAAAGAKYTAAWAVPVLALQAVLLAWRRPLGERLGSATRALGALLVVPAIGVLGLVLVTGRVPTIWSGAVAGVGQGWLDFPLWAGVLGLLASSGKGLIWYAPALVLAAFGAVPFVRRHGASAFLFVALPAIYLVTYGSKGVWHGGGWGPRYLVPAVPVLACLALPVADWLLAPERGRARWRYAAGALLLVSVGVQLLGVAKHPNLYTVLFRDHIVSQLPDYGVSLGGPGAHSYWQHFGGPGAFRQLARPPQANPSLPHRGLGYLYDEVEATRPDGSTDQTLTLSAGSARGDQDLTIYICDWNHRGRRQRIQIQDRDGWRTYDQGYDFSDCEYLTWPVRLNPGEAVTVRVDALAPVDVPVVSAIFFDPARLPAGSMPRRTPASGESWIGRFGADGYVLFGWDRGESLSRAPPGAGIVHRSPGKTVWIDTWERELEETPVLYAPGFSPLLAHAWLLGTDAVSLVSGAGSPLTQRALASPPWRYVHGLEIHSPHPEYALGLDFWQLLIRSHFRSHAWVMAAVWGATLILASGLVVGVIALRRAFHE